MSIPPDPQQESAEYHYHRDPNIDSHHFDTNPLIIAQAWIACSFLELSGIRSESVNHRVMSTMRLLGLPYHLDDQGTCLL